MSTFFAGTTRRVTIGTPSLLGGKGKPRRIRVALIFPLSGESFVAMPDWLSESLEAVSQFAQQASPEVDTIPDIALIFENPAQEANGSLFESEPAKIPSAELRKLTVLRMGESDDPDVVLACSMYADFSRSFWKWLGEYAHNEVRAKFPSTKEGMVEVVAAPEQATLTEVEPVSEEEEEAEPEDGPGSEAFEQEVREAMGAPEPLSEAPRLVRHDDPEPSPRHNGKSGPKELKAYHEEQLAKGRVN